MLLEVDHTDKPEQCARDLAVRIPTHMIAVSIKAVTYPVPAPSRGTTRHMVAVVALPKKIIRTAVGKRGKTYPFTAPVQVPDPEWGTTRRTVAVVALLNKRLKTAVGKRGKRVISLKI